MSKYVITLQILQKQHIVSIFVGGVLRLALSHIFKIKNVQGRQVTWIRIFYDSNFNHNRNCYGGAISVSVVKHNHEILFARQ